MKLFGMSSLDDNPSNITLFPEGSSTLNSLQRQNVLVLACSKVVTEFVALLYPSSQMPDEDHILAYSKETISLGLLLMEFCDGIREGDGLRILRCWKYFLSIFKACKRTYYSIETLNLLFLQFTPRM